MGGSRLPRLSTGMTISTRPRFAGSFLAKVMNTESIKKEVYDYMSEGKNFEVKIRPEKTAVVDQMKEKLSGAKAPFWFPTTNSV